MPSWWLALLEAEICGSGPSGRNGGFLHGYWASLATLLPVLPVEQALALTEAGERVVSGVRAFCESRDEDVWLREEGMLMVSVAPAQDAAVDRAVEAAAAVGRPEQAEALSAGEVRSRCASPVFRRGGYFPDGATVHPARLVRALRRAVVDAGVALYERTPALRVHSGSPNVIETPLARMKATDVVLAVNAVLTGWRPAARRLTNFGSYVVLTEPVPHLLKEIGWTRGEAIVDGRMFLHYFRVTNDGRVLMGSGSGPIGYGGRIDERFSRDAPTAARAEAGLRRLLPGLEAARLERAWGGPIDVSADHLPFFGSEGGIHYGAGYSGHGVGPSWLGGRILASLVLRADDKWTRLPLVTRSVPRLPPEPFRHVGGGLIRRAIMACEAAEEQGRRPRAAARAVAAVPRVLGLELGTR